MGKSSLSNDYKMFDRLIKFLIFISIIMIIITFSSRLYMPDDRKKMTYNWGMTQKLSSSNFVFQKYQFDDESDRLKVAISQNKISYVDEFDGKTKYKQEQYKFYTLVDGKYFSDVNVKTYDSTFKYNYILSVPLPEKYYTFYIVVERYENNVKTGDGIYSSIDYREINKKNGDVKTILNLQDKVNKCNLEKTKKQIDYDLIESKKEKTSDDVIKQKTLKKEMEQLEKDKTDLVKKLNVL